jgi:hypothetical protein
MHTMLIQPSQADVRRFFCGVYAKTHGATALQEALTGLNLSPLEVLVSGWIDEHPEHHAELADLDGALRLMEQVDPNRDNPFLHLSMHLSISEQCSIDQPRGIRQALDLLTARRNSLHTAHHEVMECLGQMVMESQQKGKPPDGAAYVACVQRHATRD